MTFDLLEATKEFITRPRLTMPSVPHMRPTEASVKYIKDGQTVIDGTCLRAIYWRYTGIPGAPSSLHLEMTGRLGKACELMMIDIWTKMGIVEDAHLKFQSARYNLSGELDTVLRDPETHERFGAEIKSIYGYYAGKEVFGNESQAGKPKPKHLLQTLVYCTELKHTLSYFAIPYIERGDGELGMFKVRTVPCEENGTIVYRGMVDDVLITDYTIEDIYSRYEQVLEAIYKRELPPREFQYKYDDETVDRKFEEGEISKSAYEAFKKVLKNGTVRINESKRPKSWQCSYCGWRKICYTDKGECID